MDIFALLIVATLSTGGSSIQVKWYYDLPQCESAKQNEIRKNSTTIDTIECYPAIYQDNLARIK